LAKGACSIPAASTNSRTQYPAIPKPHDKLKRFGFFARLGETAFFSTTGAAVSGYLATHPVDWEDGGR
jgi:hypothetical protein